MSELHAGQPFPHFGLGAACRASDGSIKETTLSLSEAEGKPLIIFFYPKDATSGCTIEVCNFRDQYQSFQESGIAVWGVSRDTVRSHGKFIENQNLPYPLLADPQRELLTACDLLQAGTMYGKPVTRVARTTFALDGNGIIRHIWHDVQPLGHATEVLTWCREHLNT